MMISLFFSHASSVALGMAKLFSLTFHLVPSAGQNFDLPNTLDYGQIPAKLTAFPNALTVLCIKW